MKSRAALTAVFGVLTACAASGARGAVLAVPAELRLTSPVMTPAVLPLNPLVASPLIGLTPLLSAPVVGGPGVSPFPVFAPPVPSAPQPLPATPIAGLQGVAAKLADAAAPGAAQANQGALDAFWNGETKADAPGAPSVVDAITVAGASPEFVAKVKAHLRANVPEPILRDMLADGYRIEINARVRQGREDLHEDNDLTGGFHSYGPQGKFIVIAEEIKHAKSGEWRKSVVWENAVNHEIGHAAAYILGEREAARLSPGDGPKEGQALWYATKGISESPEFRTAWQQDFETMPEALKQETLPNGKPNRFLYFTHPDENGWFQRARQETFAEGFDILLRGKASAFNYRNFTRRFKKSLPAIKAALERAYGPIFPR